jgi:hypothetical protein
MSKFEWYTLDNSLRRDQVIEGYESFIWTERYSDVGDFQIVIKSTFSSRQLLTTGTMIAMKGSYRIMVIDTVVDETAEDGTRDLTVTGKSLENLLNDRVAFDAVLDTTSHPNWTITDTPGNVVRTMFNQICVFGLLDPNDSIPFFQEGTLLPTGSIEEPSDEVTVSVQPDTLLNSIKTICDAYFLGFRFVRNGELGQVYFEVYTGDDRTSSQRDRNPVIFDQNLENLEKPTVLTSTAAVKNVAYVFAQNAARVVFAVGADISARGTGRRVLLVKSNNTADAGEELDAALESEGLTALAAQRITYQFDGELPSSIPYVYGVDYSLGDLVEERNSEGFGNDMLVTEQIFSSDKTGDQAYPTLTIKQLITPGTWASYDHDIEWSEEDTSIIWATL